MAWGHWLEGPGRCGAHAAQSWDCSPPSDSAEAVRGRDDVQDVQKMGQLQRQH